jgi:hypothetical protein
MAAAKRRISNEASRFAERRLWRSCDMLLALGVSAGGGECGGIPVVDGYVAGSFSRFRAVTVVSDFG